MFEVLASLCLHPLRTAALLCALLAVGLWRKRTPLGRIATRSALGLGLALLAFLPAALSFRGPPRTALVAHIKQQQAEAGRLVQAPRWGIVDLSHVDATRDHIRQARRHLQDPGTRHLPLPLVSEGGTLAGSAWQTTHVYRLVQPDLVLTDAQQDDAARAVALQAAFDLEVEQERAPWTTGLRLTAWQFEDLPSALYAVGCDPNEPASFVPTFFDGQGRELAGVLVRTFSVAEELTPEERDGVQRIREAGKLWTAEFSEPLGWADVPEDQDS